MLFSIVSVFIAIVLNSEGVVSVVQKLKGIKKTNDPQFPTLINEKKDNQILLF